MQEEKRENTLIPNFPKLEEEVLAFWEKEKVFEKTLEQTKKGKKFVFFEGPPTANGKPGIHHVLARAFKDVVLRYKTMRGYYVERKAGWDTHGLPVELQVEKALNISGKPDIEKYGVDKFNQMCKESVWKYQKEWEGMTRRIGFWLDMNHPYVTYKNEYIESLWWIIKQIWDKKLLYKGHKVVPHCPRCGTALSSHEVAQGYRDVTEDSVYVKFKVEGEKNTYILSWTTTPWTLPGNVALAVGKDIAYVKIKVGNESYIIAKDRTGSVIKLPLGKTLTSNRSVEGSIEIQQVYSGKDLVGLKYEPLFDVKPLQTEKSYQVYEADFVNTEEGTGIVHTAVMYGEDDYQLGERVGLPKYHTVDENGHFTKDVPHWAGKYVKDKVVEKGIIADLEKQGLLLKKETHTHSYPHCWRCDTPLLYYAKDSWFINMSSLREKLMKNNEDINWVPAHIKHGRFGEWLNEVKDWAFSRERFWGTPLPIWESADGDRICIGSFEELRKLAKDPTKVGESFDPHRPFVDDIILTKDAKEYRRVKEVIDVWFDSGSMPFAQWHYPFENKERIDDNVNFPAAYISEAIDQTRGWFYTLLAVSTLLGRGTPYKNVICLGHILDARGQKMSKSRGNVVDPFEMIAKYGADTLRWHFFTMNQPGDTKLFDEKNLSDVVKKNWMILWNVLSFWKMYASSERHVDDESKMPKAKHVLDRWIAAKLHVLVVNVSERLDAFAITEAGRAISEFIDDLSTWYLRRSRSRFKHPSEDQTQALATLQHALQTVAQLLAPFAPFFADTLYREVTGSKTSVHMTDWPVAVESSKDDEVIRDMDVARKIVMLGHSLRKEQSLKVRQPLEQCIIVGGKLPDAYEELIADELNVREVTFANRIPTNPEFAFKESGGVTVALDTTLTDELRHEGMVREIVRKINAKRKEQGLTVNDRIVIRYAATSDELRQLMEFFSDRIAKDTLASKVEVAEVSAGSDRLVFPSGELHFAITN
ncbi:MAG: hypothetical protein A2898_05635 [Candidatus Kerfeldbacteria bacterium RIFCSPLOWO2_01_FULL_48_11]|uniref:Isoleucine--tRNA ligase n=1 Tax=Candidatus Kerfeldbacteria bacterium RIFCSPLOWO2_01_FULL_48_11 TaxID=1798543 RepID=A0A1G2B5W7_9BACT|nr:MAG: Isoleucine-tRNA ligase [Parcubacteria group bacterium GW2011_GWA2_48_9]OGY83640.1 MAG: hypothetical protein A2898_05635 [Candidatus Kerfeldbacteria bacterium RIFCSPLOWO2_01_FULL_48_11]